MRVVRKRFRERYDSKRVYQVNDWYPRSGFDATDERVEELTKKDFLEESKEEEEEKKYPIHTGGGWYELSNGERVQGKEEAEKLEAGD
ncbi:MAG: hypothetical protein L0J75_01425 [Alkalibacterium sp.]|nr:hypothetical protein [Alkalibacterium sp.]